MFYRNKKHQFSAPSFWTMLFIDPESSALNNGPVSCLALLAQLTSPH
jgi:hypothetical protein